MEREARGREEDAREGESGASGVESSAARAERKKIMLKIVKSSFFMPQMEWVLEPGEYVIGRYPSNDIVLPDPYVSRRHARIYSSNDEWYIEDLDSTNGTIVDSEDIKGKGARKISDGSEIIIGLTVLVARFV